MDAVVVKVMGMTWYRGQFSQNRTFRSYQPRICLKCPSVQADRSKRSSVRAGISCALRFNSDRKIYPLRSCARVPSSFSASRARTPFGRDISNSGMLMNVSFYGLVSGPCPTYYGSSSISRSFSQIAKAGAQNCIITTGGSSGKNGPVNTFNKRRKSPKAFAAQKGNTTSKEELANSSSSGKAVAMEDVDPSSLKGQNVQDNMNTLVDNGAQTPKGKEKLKQSRKNKQQSQSSSINASSEAAEMPDSSKNISGAKETKKGKIKQSCISPESNLTPTEVVDSVDTAKSVHKKVRKSSAKKKKT